MTKNDKEFLKFAKYNHDYLKKMERINQSKKSESKKMDQLEKNQRKFRDRCKNLGLYIFHFCDCGNELNTSGSFIECIQDENENGSYEISIFLCSNCKKETILDYGLIPYTRDECSSMNIKLPTEEIVNMKARYIQAKRRKRIKKLTNEVNLYIINLMNCRHI